MRITEGATLVFETGEYSDYSFTGPFRVLRAFDQAEIVEAYKAAWRAEHPTPGVWDEADSPGLVAWMVKGGYVEDVPNVVSWHIGSYGRLEPEIQQASGDADAR